ncbi:hypothetical protein IW262DRAFT_210284 [Armillaria fumosa]|nr:hypothetical protein IW262DRAFT_210284 [Armillaria fumosa]
MVMGKFCSYTSAVAKVYRVLHDGVQVPEVSQRVWQYHDLFDLELLFFDISQIRRFVIQRKVCTTVSNLTDHEQLAPQAPYSQQKRRNFKLDGLVIDSLCPPTWAPHKLGAQAS